MNDVKTFTKTQEQPFLAWFRFLLWLVSVVSLCGRSIYYERIDGESLLERGLPWVLLPRQQRI